jgi:hypothetical protein
MCRSRPELRCPTAPSALQHADGSIDDGTRWEAPGIAVGGVHWEDSMDGETARRLAHLLVTAADEVDRWAASSETHDVGDRS